MYSWVQYNSYRSSLDHQGKILEPNQEKDPAKHPENDFYTRETCREYGYAEKVSKKCSCRKGSLKQFLFLQISFHCKKNAILASKLQLYCPTPLYDDGSYRLYWENRSCSVSPGNAQFIMFANFMSSASCHYGSLKIKFDTVFHKKIRSCAQLSAAQ